MTTRGRSGRRVRLRIPPTLLTALGYDAVGVAERDGYQLMERLPRVGCVFADTSRWWLIVPSGSNLGLVWPRTVQYAVGASVPLGDRGSRVEVGRPEDAEESAGSPAGPRLIHWPGDATPYTPPIPLYLMVCQLAGAEPDWSLGRPGGGGGGGGGGDHAGDFGRSRPDQMRNAST